jgi:hypothetical protein
MNPPAGTVDLLEPHSAAGAAPFRLPGGCANRSIWRLPISQLVHRFPTTNPADTRMPNRAKRTQVAGTEPTGGTPVAGTKPTARTPVAGTEPRQRRGGVRPRSSYASTYIRGSSHPNVPGWGAYGGSGSLPPYPSQLFRSPQRSRAKGEAE